VETEIYFNEKLVFLEVEDMLCSFIPGNWEKVLDRLYKKALKKNEQIRKEEKQKRKKEALIKEEEEKRRWGLK